ncbi:MAG: tagaturonate epimerase family protein [Anaerolineae bacterium]|nr:tagaturonate epimerase family protein [Anaerolineae bacterium]
MSAEHRLPVIQTSVVRQGGTTYALVQPGNGEKALLVSGDSSGFVGEAVDDGLLCPRSGTNAAVLRDRLPWLNPVPLGLRVSAGFGDRLGIATPGHIQAVQGTGVAPVFAQQSVRENTRTGRTPQGVLDDAMWGVFESGWRDPWGADADHMKTLTDITPFVEAGYTFFTIDPSDHVDDAAETDDMDTLRRKTAALDWGALRASLSMLDERYRRTFQVDTVSITFDEHTLLKALAKYGAAVAHTAQMAAFLLEHLHGRPFDLEMSVDETGTTTSLHEHFFIVSELRRLDVPFVSLAPRFVGRFEKGVDYIGDLDDLDENIAGHAAIMRYFGGSYKLSLHTGSDKFTVYPIATRHTGGLVHLKTAGTSYLEALRLMASVNPALFRQVLDFSRGRYETDRRTYHVSAVLDKVPGSTGLSDPQLPDLLNQFDARQVLHVTFGSVLDHFGEELRTMLRAHGAEYHTYLQRHFARHLAPFKAAIGR